MEAEEKIKTMLGNRVRALTYTLNPIPTFQVLGLPTPPNTYGIIFFSSISQPTFFSLDGIVSCVVISRLKTITVNFSTNKTINHHLYIKPGTQFFAKCPSQAIGNRFIGLTFLIQEET